MYGKANKLLAFCYNQMFFFIHDMMCVCLYVHVCVSGGLITGITSCTVTISPTALFTETEV